MSIVKYYYSVQEKNVLFYFAVFPSWDEIIYTNLLYNISNIILYMGYSIYFVLNE